MPGKIDIKLILVLFLHALIYIVSLYLIKMYFGVFESGLHNVEIIFISLFSASYFLYLSRNLYLKPYHSYLIQSFSVIARSLPLFTLLFMFGELFYVNIRPGLAQAVGSDHNLRIVFKYMFLLFIYISFFLFQYSWVVHLAKLGFFRKNTLLVGEYDKRIPLDMLFQDIHHTKNYVGHIKGNEGGWYFESPVAGTDQKVDISIFDFLFKNKVNEMIICQDDNIDPETLRQLVGFCLDNSIGYYLIPDIQSLPNRKPWNHRFSNIPVIERFSPNRDSLLMLSVKRVFDIVVSIFGLIVFSPLFIAISLIILIQDKGNVIYASERIGIHGYPIRFYKFRTMVLNAENLKKDLMKFNERPDGPLFKMKDDPRVTSIGKFLRKYSLDELPQLWNVLKGDMSIIGPRPHLPEEVSEYDPLDHLRLECIPGVSCLPQIRGRNELGFREWVDLDLEYRKNWSLKYDFLIFFQTIRVVLNPLFTRFSRARV